MSDAPLTLAEGVVELEKDLRGEPRSEYMLGRQAGIKCALALLRRVALEPTVPAAAVARIVALRDHCRGLPDMAGLDRSATLTQVLSIIAEEAPEPTGEDTGLLDALGAMQSDWWKVEVNSHGVSISVFDYDKGKWRGWIETDDRDLRAALRQLAEQQAGAK